jgi:hypothetical protein
MCEFDLSEKTKEMWREIKLFKMNPFEKFTRKLEEELYYDFKSHGRFIKKVVDTSEDRF